MKNNIKNKLMIIVLACVFPYGQAVNGFTIGEATFSGDSFTSVGDYIAGMDWKTIGIATAIAIVTAGAASELVAVAVAEQTAMEAAIVTIDAIQAARVAGEAAAAATDAVAAGGEASLAASEAAGGLEVNQIGFTIDEATKEAADAAFNAAFDASMEASSSAAGGIPTPLIDAPIAAQAGQAASDLVIAAAKASQAVETASAAAAQADATAQAAAIEASNTANEAARAAALLTNPGNVGAANAAGNAAGDLAFAESMEASSTAIAQAKAAAEAARVVASQASLLASEGVGSANSAAYLASLADQAAAQAAADAATQAAAQATAQAVADAAVAQAAAEAADPLTVATTAKNAASQEVFDAAQAAAQKNGVTLTQDELEEQFGEQAYAAGSRAYDASIAQSAAQSEAAAAAASPEAQAAAARQTALQTTKETYIQFATKTIDGIRSANPGMTIQTAATLSQPTLAASPQFLAYASATQAVGVTLTPAMSTALFMASLAEAVPVVGEAVLGAGAGIGIASAVGTSGTPPPTAFTDKIPGATSMSPAIVAQSIAKAVYGTAATSNSCNWVSVPLAKVIPGVSVTPVNLGITDPYPNYPEFLVMYYSDGSVRTVSKGNSIPSLSLGVTIIGANFGCGASPMDVTALVKVWVATNSSAVASELTFNLDPGAVEFDVSHAKLTITFNNGTSVVINRGQAINDTIAAALGVKRTVTITNNSPWTDDGVYLQCSPTTPIAKLAGNLSSNGGSTTTTFPLGYLQPSTTGSLQCPNKATIYIALRVATPTTPGQFFTFKGINITDGITIGQTGDGRMTVNGTPYSRSGDGSIPGIDLLYAGAARVAPLINKSPWSIDGVYMQCRANTPATKLAGSLSSNGGTAITTYPYCSDPSDPLNKPTLPFIYVASQGQFFTFFANTIHGLTIDATTPINITPTTIGVNKMAIQPPTDNFMTVNGVKYISSGAKSIPGIDFVYPGADPAAAQTGAQASAIVKATYGVPNAAGSSCSWLDVPASFLSTINSNQGFNMNDSSGLPNFSQLKRTVILYFADGSTKSFDPDSQFSIVSMSAPALSGSYGCGTLMDVTTALRNILAAKPLATASNTTFGFDPDPGKAKVLTITLSNGMIITINEGQGISAAITAAQKGVPLPGFDYKYYLDNSPDFAVAAAANNISGAINHFYLYGFRDARPIKLTDAKGNVYTGTWNLSAYNAFKGINAAPDLQLIPIFWQAAYSGGNANGAVLTPAAAQAAAQAAAIVTAQTAANSRLPGFDVAFYVALNPTVSPAGAVDDYLKNDGGKGTKMIRLIDPSGINHDGYFVLADYILIYPDLVINNAYGYNQATTDEGRIKALFTHYQSNGYKEGRTIIFSTKAAADAIAIGIAQTAANVRLPGFNVAFYLSLHPTVSPANATQDYLDNDGGKGTTMIQLVDQIGANHTGYFVLADYITMYPDLVTAAVGYNQATTDEGRIKALFSHYKTNGYKEGRTIVFPAKAIADAAAQTATIAAAQSAAAAQNQASLIAKATYGMPNVAGSLCTTWVDIPTAQVIALAGSKTPVTWTSLGLSADPAPGIIKTLMVYYHNGQSTKVPYGGTLAATPTGTTIIGASFGCGTLMDVTAAVKNIVAIKSSATASSTTFGADQGLGKTLTIYFNNGDSPVTISDGQAINAAITSAQAAAAAQNQISLISKATYGMPNAAGSSCTVWGDVPAAKVIALAGSKTPVTWTSLGLAADPAPGIIKTLIVYYNNGLTVKVPYGGTIAATPAGTTIIGANFGCGTLMDVTAAVKNIVVTNSSATATDITFGANPGTGKMLTIYFTNRSTPWTIAQGQGINEALAAVPAAAQAVVLNSAQQAADLRLPGFNVAFYLSLHPTVSPANATQDYLDNDGGKGTTMIQLVDQIGANHTGYFVLADYEILNPDLILGINGYKNMTLEAKIQALFGQYKTTGYKEGRTIVFLTKASGDTAAQAPAALATQASAIAAANVAAQAAQAAANVAAQAAQLAAAAHKQALLITKATYGTPNATGSSCSVWGDVPAAQVIALAGSKTPVTWTSLGLSADPAPGIIKTLLVYYNNGLAVKVPYGGTLAATPTGTAIIGASFGCGTLMDVTAAVKNIVATNSSATATDTTFGANPGTGKALTIYFTNSNTPVTIAQGQAINAAITAAIANAAAQAAANAAAQAKAPAVAPIPEVPAVVVPAKVSVVTTIATTPVSPAVVPVVPVVTKVAPKPIAPAVVPVKAPTPVISAQAKAAQAKAAQAKATAKEEAVTAAKAKLDAADRALAAAKSKQQLQAAQKAVADATAVYKKALAQ